ncbi:MAG: DUF2207 domain-containing protein [Eubacteriales bacterium]|nr:DUF2207 domain-containing protein [Eubacteriales bacterium]
MHNSRNLYRMLLIIAGMLIVMMTAVGCESSIGKPDYSAESYIVNVFVAADGSASVTEQMLLKFNDDSERLDLYVNRLRNSRLTDLEIAVSDKNPDPEAIADPTGKDLILQAMQPVQTEASNISQMTWQQQDQEDAIRLRLNINNDSGVSRFLVMTYKLESFVKKSSDAAYIRHMPAALEPQITIRDIRLKYTLPYQPQNGDSWLRMVGQNQPDVSLVDVDVWSNSWQSIVAENIPEAVLVMPSEYFPEVDVSPGLASRAALINDAESRMRSTQDDNFWRDSVRALVFFLMIMSGVFLLIIYLVFDREGVTNFRAKYLLPERCDLPPAVMSLLMRNSKPANLIMSTLIDLVRRNELKLEGMVFTWNNPDRNDYYGFRAYEIYLLQWLFDRVSAGSSSLSAVQLKDYARNRSTAEEFRGYYDQFVELLSEELPGYGLFDETKSHYGRVIGQSLAAAYLVLSLLASVFLMSWIGLLLMIPSCAFFLYAQLLRHLTGYGNEEYAKGKAIRRYLANFYELKQNGHDITLIECQQSVYMLPYAIALDKTKLFMRQMLLMAKTEGVCSRELLDVYQPYELYSRSAKIVKEKSETVDTASDSQTSAAAKAAALEQLRLLGRDLVSMESILTSGFYLASSFHLMSDH